MGDLSETSMTNTHPGVAQAATKNAGSVTLGAVRVRRNRDAHAHAWAKEPAQADVQKRRPSKGGDELLHQNKGQGVSCWSARPLAYPPPLDGSIYMYTYIYIHISISISIYLYIHIHTHTHTHTHTHIHTRIYIYIYIHT